MVFRFGEFELDDAAYKLRLKGSRIRLARQPMDLLFLLVRRPGELVSREDIASGCRLPMCSSTATPGFIPPS